MIAIAIDAILVLVLCEGLAFFLFNRWTGRGLAPAGLLPNLAAGFILMLAVRLALAHGADVLIAGCLFAALIAHVVDLACRWKR